MSVWNDVELNQPKYWGSHLVAGFLKFLGQWPDGMRFRLGQFLGFIAPYVAKRRMNIARTNLHLCFPDWNETQIEQVVRGQISYFMQSIVDRPLFWFGPKNGLFTHIKTVNEHYLHEALAQNCPVIVLAPHFVGLDAGGVRFNMERPAVSMYQRQSNPVLDRLTFEGRTRAGQSHLYSRQDGVRQLVKLLRQNLPLYYLPDLDFGRKDSIFVPFFEQSAATLTALPKLSKLTHALVLPCVTRIDPESMKIGKTRYIMQYYPAWQNYPEAYGDEEQAVRFMNEFIEQRILETPEQYLWMHKRFKTRPEGQDSVY